MTRAFLAVVPPPGALDAVAGLVARLRGTVRGSPRWTRREQWHLTLRFLGDDADVDALADALAALREGPGEVGLGGAGAFPAPRHGRVLWIGLDRGAALLAGLAGAVDEIVAPLGLPPDERPFHPHLTLARWRAPTDLRATVATAGAAPVGPAWTVRDVVLFESRTLPAGAEHVARARFDLGPG